MYPFLSGKLRVPQRKQSYEVQTRAYRIRREMKTFYVGEDRILLLDYKVCDMKIEIVIFVLNEIVKLSEPPNLQE